MFLNNCAFIAGPAFSSAFLELREYSIIEICDWTYQPRRHSGGMAIGLQSWSRVLSLNAGAKTH